MKPDGVPSALTSASSRKSAWRTQGALREEHVAFLPELGERRHGDVLEAVLLAAVLVDLLDPLHLVHAAGVFGVAVEAPGEAAEDLEVGTRVEQRVDELLHRDDAAVAVRAVAVEVVTLEGRARRQHDVGEAAGGGPVVVDGDHGFELCQACFMRLRWGWRCHWLQPLKIAIL
jgi:hypothetical protein